MPSRYLEKTVLLVQPGVESSGFLQIPENRPFITGEGLKILKRSERGRTPQMKPQSLEIAVQTDNIPKNVPRGWIFGRNPKACDYLLDADESHGISDQQFEIFHNPTSLVVMIRNLSQYDLGIRVNQAVDLVKSGDQRALCSESTTIEVGTLIFYLVIPDRGDLQSTYEQNLRTYLKSAENRIPDISLLAVQRRGVETPAVKGALANSPTAPLEKYSFRWKVGVGGSGTVYNAIDRSSGFEVAIKVFHDKTEAKSIALEIDILKSVIHTHITRYIGITGGPSSHLVMEFVHGGSMDDLRGIISRHEAILMARQTSQAVSYLHDQAITHRDIKPANILVPSRGDKFFCKIADFGASSRQILDLTSFHGTPMYHAPEIDTETDTRNYDKSVDIWSLGVIYAEYFYLWNREDDDCLPDTATGTPSPSEVDDFDNLGRRLSSKRRWHDTIRGKVQKEDDPVASIIVHMLEDDPSKRWEAGACRHHFDNVALPDESDIYRKPKGPHKRGIAQADIGIADTSPRSRRRSEGHTPNPTLGSIYEERSADTLCSIPPSFAGAEMVPTSRSSRLGSLIEVPQPDLQKPTPGEEVIVRLYPNEALINLFDLLKATTRTQRLKWTHGYECTAPDGGTSICYEQAKIFIRYLGLPEDMIDRVERAMSSKASRVSLRREKTIINTACTKKVSGKKASGKKVSGKKVSGKKVSGKKVSGKKVSGKKVSGKKVSGKKVSGKKVSGSEVESTLVRLDPDESLVNATHICAAAGVGRSRLIRWKADNGITPSRIDRRKGLAGTWITHEQGLELSKYLGMSTSALVMAIRDRVDCVWVPISERQQAKVSRIGEGSSEGETEGPSKGTETERYEGFGAANSQAYDPTAAYADLSDINWNVFLEELQEDTIR